MAHYETYGCDQCGGRFRWMHHPDNSPPPDVCQLCGAPSELSAAFLPQAPAIKGVRIQAAEQVYRGMEAASEARTHQMAELGGGDASDYSHTKITDLNTQQREGDLAYKMPSPGQNAVADFMRQNPTATGTGAQSANEMQEHAAAAHQGYFPHAGDRTRSVVGNVHHTLVRQMANKGRLNSNNG